MNKLLLSILLLSTTIAQAQKLQIDAKDPETGKRVKETEWLKIKGTDRTRLKIKFKRIGDEIILYYTINAYKRGSSGKTDSKNHIEITFANNEKLNISMPEFTFSLARVETQKKSSVPGIPLTATPEGLATNILTKEQLSALQNKSIIGFDSYFYEMFLKVSFKKKDIDKLKEYIALVM